MGAKNMKRNELDKARNPWLSGALVAIRRAAARARKEARMTHTAIVVLESGRLKRIPADKIGETAGVYGSDLPPGDEGNP
jgi:hypothetical protein